MRIRYILYVIVAMISLFLYSIFFSFLQQVYSDCSVTHLLGYEDEQDGTWRWCITNCFDPLQCIWNYICSFISWCLMIRNFFFFSNVIVCDSDQRPLLQFFFSKKPKLYWLRNSYIVRWTGGQFPLLELKCKNNWVQCWKKNWVQCSFTSFYV